MISIINHFVEQHIHSFTIDDLKYYADKYSFSYSEEELKIVYSFLKTHYKDLLNQNIRVFETIKQKLSPALYNQLLECYIDLKQKYL